MTINNYNRLSRDPEWRSSFVWIYFSVRFILNPGLTLQKSSLKRTIIFFNWTKLFFSEPFFEMPEI